MAAPDSKENATYAVFREVGRVIRTVQLLRYLCDPALRRRVTAATNNKEAFNGFSQWIGFGNRGVIVDNDPVEQEKAMKFNVLLTNVVIFHNALDIAEIVRQLLEEGWTTEQDDLARISPYPTEHINRFGEYSTHELGIQSEAYDSKLDLVFAPFRDQDPAVGFTIAGRHQMPISASEPVMEQRALPRPRHRVPRGPLPPTTTNRPSPRPCTPLTPGCGSAPRSARTQRQAGDALARTLPKRPLQQA
ncbi:Tn3 family transposase [Streptomyces sp. SM11]|uniref:Tn3 family transposase n=1 Tax=Streptomyces sp. SM11 TaxID=565557 RepID=UPI0015E1A1D3|nr:Tn3 family transposase [Streptomyces sp. SM11]